MECSGDNRLALSLGSRITWKPFSHVAFCSERPVATVGSPRPRKLVCLPVVFTASHGRGRRTSRSFQSLLTLET